MKLRSITIACLSSLLLVISPSLSLAEETMTPMFNGTDFTGWVRTNTPPETWRYEDGLLVCSGKPNGEIRTEKMYQNFVMELEWRHMVPRGNAGVFIWADDIPARGTPFHRGIEVQVLENAYGNNDHHTTHGDVFPIQGATMTPINGRKGSRAFPTEDRALPSPQWNHYRIEGRDGEVTLSVNGKVVTRGKDAVPRKGYVCLESEGGVVHYRNVQIRELPDTPLAPEHVAIADRGYRSLYSGLDFRGWDRTDGDDRWTTNGWILSFKGDAKKAGRLVSSDSFERLGFVVDVRLNSDTSQAAISLGPTVQIDSRQPEIAKVLEPSGNWNRFEGTMQNGEYVLLVNGNPVSPTPIRYTDGPVSITLSASGIVDFANVFARSLSK
jgi:hypothetical protein